MICVIAVRMPSMDTLQRGYMGPFSSGWTESDVEIVVLRGDPEELLYVPIVVGMNADMCEPGWAEKICLQLAGHEHFNVRGNAVLGLGHIARTCRTLNLDLAVPVIAEAMHDPHDFVRGHALSAAEELNTYLGVKVPGYVESSWEDD